MNNATSSATRVLGKILGTAIKPVNAQQAQIKYDESHGEVGNIGELYFTVVTQLGFRHPAIWKAGCK
jgi:hypothetical protein